MVKTGYKPKKLRKTDKFQAPRRSVTDFPKQATRLLQDRREGDTVQAIKEVSLPFSTGFPLAIPGDFGSYLGQHKIPSISGDLCKIKFKNGWAFLPDDGEHFRWVD